jgi:hypothetical protein
MPRQCHPPSFHHSNIQLSIQVMKQYVENSDCESDLFIVLRYLMTLFQLLMLYNAKEVEDGSE